MKKYNVNVIFQVEVGNAPNKDEAVKFVAEMVRAGCFDYGEAYRGGDCEIEIAKE
jgi:hypothetical protein